jgi:hypothetical protein
MWGMPGLVSIANVTVRHAGISRVFWGDGIAVADCRQLGHACCRSGMRLLGITAHCNGDN